jgi:hypothetical protein
VRYRTTRTVTYTNSSIAPGTMLETVLANTIPPPHGDGIRRQMKRASLRPAPGEPQPEQIVAVFWDGQHRTVPLRFLAPVE